MRTFFSRSSLDTISPSVAGETPGSLSSACPPRDASGRCFSPMQSTICVWKAPNPHTLSYYAFRQPTLLDA